MVTMTAQTFRSFRRLAVFGLLAALPAAALAQQRPANGALTARVDALFADYNKPDSPGCALGIYRDGAILYSRGYGMADLERGVPITPRTVFDIGSTSKQFSAAAIVLLAQDGTLTLDDDVRTWVPELPDYGARITIRHLLLHTSGLRDYIGLLTLAGHRIDDVTDAEDALRILARQQALNFAPGAEHLYSNSGYFLLSTIVERAARKTLQAFARERIFAPLGMTKTHYLGSYDDIVPDRALAYAPRPGGGLRQDISRWLQVGDGAVFTTVEDLLRWDNNFYVPKVGGQALLDTLQATGRLNDGTPLTYALGLGVSTYRGQRIVGHGGSWGGYRAELLRFPDQRFSVATLCNLGTINPTQLARRVADVYLEDVLAPAETAAATPSGASVDASAVTAYTGLYRHPVTRARLNVTLLNAQLTVLGDGRFDLRPRAANVFGADGTSTTWTFAPGEAGEPVRLTRKQDGVEAEVFEKIAPLKASAAELSSYAGRYYSEELDATFTLAVEDGVLTVRRRGAGPQRLAPIVRDEFMAGSATMRFERGEDGEVSGYVMDLGRVRNLRFARSGNPR
jgi:CubicO group peptidase (beta-lactamase class C family)